MKKQAILTLTAGMMVLSACSKVEELDKRTKTMTDTTTEMAKTTGEMKDVTSHMYPQIRTKEAEDTRNKKMQIILDKQSGMGARIAASAIYFQSFEFQFWNNNKSFDTEETRQRLFVDAANEFFRRAADIYNRIDTSKLTPTVDDPEKKSNEMAFLALSAAMHMLNHHQEQIHEETGKTFELVSFYDMMKSALRKDKNGEALTEAEAIFVTGTNKEISLELVKARTNMLLGLAVSYMIDLREIDDASLADKGAALLGKLSHGKYGKIKLTSLFESANEVTQKEINKRLDGSISARQLLSEVGVSVKVDATMKNILNNLVFNEKSMRNGTVVTQNEYKSYRTMISLILR